MISDSALGHVEGIRFRRGDAAVTEDEGQRLGDDAQAGIHPQSRRPCPRTMSIKLSEAVDHDDAMIEAPMAISAEIMSAAPRLAARSA